jgi:arylsulfatase A-like enzyme
VLFEQAISPTSWTLPAHATLLTALAQHHHQTVSVKDKLPASVERLPESFGRAGYETIGFYSGPFLEPSFGFRKGFDAYVSCEDKATTPLDDHGHREDAHDARTNSLIYAAFKSWLDRRAQPERPFFAFVHMWDVHYDYIPPEPYASMFDPDYTGPLNGRDILGDGFPLDASPRDVQHLEALYDGEIRSTDDTIDRLLGDLDRLGALDRTLVVVTADHGDEFLEHGGKGHRRTLYEEVVHVPLIVWVPPGRWSEVKRGTRVAQPVGLQDVAPTILELAGLPPLQHADGRSLTPLLEGRPLEDLPVFSALYSDYFAIRLASIRRGTQTLLFDSLQGTWDVYDLVTDPGEQHAIQASQLPDKTIKRMLAAYDDQAREVLLPHMQAHQKAKKKAAIPESTMERLRELGYVK